MSSLERIPRQRAALLERMRAIRDLGERDLQIRASEELLTELGAHNDDFGVWVDALFAGDASSEHRMVSKYCAAYQPRDDWRAMLDRPQNSVRNPQLRVQQAITDHAPNIDRSTGVARLFTRLNEIAALEDIEDKITACQLLTDELHTQPNDLMLFTDAIVRKDMEAAQRLADRYGPSYRPVLDWSGRFEHLRTSPSAAKIKDRTRSLPNPQPSKAKGSRMASRAKAITESREPNFQRARSMGTSETRALCAVQGIPPEAVLRLDDILDFLLSKEGQPLTRELYGLYSESDAGQFSRSAAHPLMDITATSKPPKDPLGRRLVEYYLIQRDRGLLREGLTQQEVLTTMPHAAVTALSEIATNDGLLNVGVALQALGPRSTDLVTKLSKALEHGARAVASQRRGAKFRFLPKEVSKTVAASSRQPDIDERMKGFWKIVEVFGGPEAMKNVRVGRSGHLVETSDALLRAWMASGAEPGAHRGKHYSANPEYIHREQNQGWQGPNAYSTDHDVTAKNYRHPDEAFWGNLLVGINPEDPNAPTLLTYDDGFEMLRRLHELVKSGQIQEEYLKLVAAVEQTEKGALNCEDMIRSGDFMRVSPTNMPRSWLKKMIEGPAIGECVAWHVFAMLKELDEGLEIKPKEAAIVGYGAVGRATAEALRRRGFKVHVYDHNPAQMLAAYADGHEIGCDAKSLAKMTFGALSEADESTLQDARAKAFAKGHLALDCTPGPGWTRDEFEMFPNEAVMGNAGSGTHWKDPKLDLPDWSDGLPYIERRKRHLEGEDIDGRHAATGMSGLLGYLDPPEQRDLLCSDSQEWINDRGMRQTNFKGRAVETGDLAGRETNYHQVVRTDDGQERLILYGGSVVNLKYGLPPEYAQVTYSLLYVAGLIALAHTGDESAQWHDIPDDWQKLMRHIIEEQLESLGLSLTEPDFNKTPPLTG